MSTLVGASEGEYWPWSSPVVQLLECSSRQLQSDSSP
jgi:hypothetical protein